MSTPLPTADVAKVLDRAIPAPQSHRSLSYEKQIDFCLRAIAQEVALCDPHAVVRTEQVARDGAGAPIFEPDGVTPKAVASTVLRSSVVGAHWKAQLASVRAAYARRLQKSNAEHAQDAEDLQRAIAREFGEPKDRAGLHAEVQAYAREYQREHGHFQG
ncbi:MAG TPA: hypothetical protein VFS67_35555 [Polyangiaceae bacterium]|nr:hypothetical protein [Polyangiaceae bacterium]